MSSPVSVVSRVFLIVGIGLLGGAAFAYDRMVAEPRRWPLVDAEIVSSRVVNPDGPSVYSPRFVFRIADGDGTRDVRVAPSWSSSSSSLVQSHVSRFPRGAHVRVAINPADGNDLRYDLSLSWINLLLPGILGFIGAVFTTVGFFTGRIGTPNQRSR